MFTFETSDPKEARRFRIAQFNGRIASTRQSGAVVAGHIRSIVENKASVPAVWTITLIPEEPKAPIALRPVSRARSFMEDFA